MRSPLRFVAPLLSFVATDDAVGREYAYAWATTSWVSPMFAQFKKPSQFRSRDDELADRGVPRGACGDGRCDRDGGAPTAFAPGATEELRSRQAENRGVVWLVAGFVFCPCHLPLTLGLLGAVLAGTAAGALLRDDVVVAAVIVSVVWALATWRGVWLLRRGRRYAERVRERRQ